MTLADGSFVHLNSVSSITYPNKFDDNSRDIEIVGEAYFNIQRDEERSFYGWSKYCFYAVLEAVV